MDADNDSLSFYNDNEYKFEESKAKNDFAIDFLSTAPNEKMDDDQKEKSFKDDFFNVNDVNNAMDDSDILKPTINQDSEVKIFHNGLGVGVNETNEKFISSEDLLADFKDPIDSEHQKASSPVSEPTKFSVAEMPTIPIESSAPSKPSNVEKDSSSHNNSSGQVQIEAEKIFESIGLGECNNIHIFYSCASIIFVFVAHLGNAHVLFNQFFSKRNFNLNLTT
jgi:hypothetical protein